ncbi:MAG: cytidine deaminase [Terrimonas sp.]|nr:cytidine deaminase [Terrimonas sp.]OJY99795.1 MAG: cytidine deaminase [Sphingobacteriales bacterium 40-81]
MPAEKKHITLSYSVFESVEALMENDKALLLEARNATGNAYAPYSMFTVGAAALLYNGEIVKGSNQENASSPAGLCAERVLLSAISSFYPKIGIDTIAISYFNKKNNKSGKPVAPCGICRQSILEYQLQQQKSIRLILAGMEGAIYIIENIADLLPFSFSGSDML